MWINLLGADGPLYVPTEQILTALRGAWTAIESSGGRGSWAILRRST
ncbi:hypothetical protein [Nonomuraea lactucae]|nr:hypothetical protein [Nonomuraea lactucae]